MLKSIQHFNEISIHKFEKLENNFLRNPTDIASYVLELTNELHNLGIKMIKESLELLDRMITESLWRQENWVVDRHSQKQLITFAVIHSLNIVYMSHLFFEVYTGLRNQSFCKLFSLLHRYMA